jgi:hypothetical protein
MFNAIRPIPHTNQTDATFSMSEEWTVGEEGTIKLVASGLRNPSPRRQILLSRWCAVVVERTLEKLIQFPRVRARAI